MFFAKGFICLFPVTILVNLLTCRCEMSPKIVGGDYGKIRYYPHAVFLSCYCNEGQMWSCGASVLNQRVLLTAAHCLEDCFLSRKGNVIFAFAGSEDYSNKNAVKRTIEKTIIHEKYDEDNVLNDIALAKLVKLLPLGEFIKRVILPMHFPAEKNGVVAGWGVVNEKTRHRESKLKFVGQQVQNRNICSRIRGLAAGMFCAKNVRTDSSFPSLGDSGSGLVTSNGEELGLVSFKDLKFNNLLVYTNVTFYYNWIATKAKILVCNQ